ncbi:MAG: hypothetical protein ACYTF9_01010 [Planctomycetota bacterium]|jgi:hypothetical protein
MQSSARIRVTAACAVAFLTLAGAAISLPRLVGGAPGHLLGAGEGEPVPFETIVLPEVNEGPLNDAPALIGPYAPLFEAIATGHLLVTNEAQLRNIWRRCFVAPYDPSLVDFDNDFLVVAGSGLIHPSFGFDITAVEAFTAEFIGPEVFPDMYLESGLAVIVTTQLPGPPPPKMDPVFRLVAVAVSREHLAPTVVSRQIIALP